MQKRNWLLLFALLVAIGAFFVASDSKSDYEWNAPVNECSFDTNSPPFFDPNTPYSPTCDPNAPLIEADQARTDQVTSQAGQCLVDRTVDLRGRTNEIIPQTEDCVTSLEQLTLDGAPVTGLFVSPNAQITVEGSTLYCWPSTFTGKMTCVKQTP
jgi:hypothetical protein